ncbi:hypothetical protein DTO271G3_2092 [Paecilomyces variotii]|nr:hypothetical protein DTO271G3_2092 [Paecilomyces variotii]
MPGCRVSREEKSRAESNPALAKFRSCSPIIPTDRFGDKIGTPAITALVRRVLQLAFLSSHLFTSPFAPAIDASTFVIL